MAERYIRQFEFTNTVHMANCPVALEKGAVLFDTKTDTYHLQLKFANIGAVGIASICMCVEAFNDSGHSAYPEISATYDEYTVVGDTFGTKKLLPIPDNNATSFRVYVEKIITIGGDTLSFSKEQYISSHQSDITAMREKAAFEKQQQIKPIKAGINWHHVALHILFAINAIALILISTRFRIYWSESTPFVPRILMIWYWGQRHIGSLLSFAPVLIFFWFLLLSAWVSIGKPIAFKRFARMAIFIPVGYILYDIIVMLVAIVWWGEPFGRTFELLTHSHHLMSLAIFFSICAAPFLCNLLRRRNL